MKCRVIDRREFLLGSLAFTAMTGKSQESTSPLRFAHRQANMVTAPGQNVFELASLIPGLSGVQLQMIWKGEDLSERETALVYKRQADRSAIEVPSIAGIWKNGEKIFDVAAADKALSNAIRTAEFFGAKTILIALFTNNCPDMDNEGSFGPVVHLLQNMGQRATDAGVSFGLETSLSPFDEKKLLDLIDRSSVGSYYDATNLETYHQGQGVSGIEVLGSRIVECHLKNEDRLIGQQPSAVDWIAALKAFKRIHYHGWYVFETRHASPERCIEDTKANIDFVKYQVLSQS